MRKHVEPGDWVQGYTETHPQLAYLTVGTGRTVILLHGVGGDSRTWDAQRNLATDEVRLVAWDARGYGRSEPTASFSFDDLREDLLRLLHHLHVPSADLVGHSMGGLVAQHFYARYPGRVRSLVLVDSTASLRKSMTDADVEEFLTARRHPLLAGKSMRDLAPILAPALTAAGASEAVMRRICKMMGDLDPAHYLRALETVTRYEGCLNLGSVRVPTLIVVGECDALTPPRVAAELARSISGARYLQVAGAGHLVPMEAPETFNATLSFFLSAVHSNDDRSGSLTTSPGA